MLFFHFVFGRVTKQPCITVKLSVSHKVKSIEIGRAAHALCYINHVKQIKLVKGYAEYQDQGCLWWWKRVFGHPSIFTQCQILS